MRHLNPSINQTIGLLSLAVSMTTAPCLLPGSSFVTSTALAQNTISSQLQGRTDVEKRDIASRPPSNTTLSQGRTRHRLIRKPLRPQARAVAPSTASANTAEPLPSAAAPASETTTEDSASQSKSSSLATSGTPQGSLSIVPTASSSFTSSVAQQPSPGMASVSGNGFTAAASRGTTSSGGSSSPRTLRRLLSEMPGMTQLVSPPSLPPPTLVESIPPAIGASPTSLSFTATQGGSNPATQTLNISNTGGGTLTWSAGDNAAWLTLTPASGSGNGTVTLTATTGTLPVGTYSGAITLSATGAASTTIPVTFTVAAAPVPPAIGASPTSLSFTATQGGGNPASQTLNVSNTGGGTLTWNAADTAAWLTLGPGSGTGNGTVTVSAATGTLAVGTYNGVITLSATGTSTVSVPVTFAITAAPSLTVDQTSLSFTATQGGAGPANQTMNVTSNLSWTVSKTGSWLTVSPASGSNNGTTTVAIDVATATVGTNTGTVTVTGGGITRTVNVTLTLNAPLSSSATLTWTANSESDLAGYKIYRATGSGTYGAPLAVLPTTQTLYQATGLETGTTYFFVVTAYDSAGNESPYSNEVSKSIF